MVTAAKKCFHINKSTDSQNSHVRKVRGDQQSHLPDEETDEFRAALGCLGGENLRQDASPGLPAAVLLTPGRAASQDPLVSVNKDPSPREHHTCDYKPGKGPRKHVFSAGPRGGLD